MLRTERSHQSEALTVQEQDVDVREPSGLGESCHAKGYSLYFLQRQPWGATAGPCVGELGIGTCAFAPCPPLSQHLS